jgi:hypothetical protein
MKINVNGVVRDMTAEEIAQREQDAIDSKAKKDAQDAEDTAKANLKASAKAKLIAGEALTEDEANVMIGG